MHRGAKLAKRACQRLFQFQGFFRQHCPKLALDIGDCWDESELRALAASALTINVLASVFGAQPAKEFDSLEEGVGLLVLDNQVPLKSIQSLMASLLLFPEGDKFAPSSQDAGAAAPAGVVSWPVAPGRAEDLPQTRMESTDPHAEAKLETCSMSRRCSSMMACDHSSKLVSCTLPASMFADGAGPANQRRWTCPLRTKGCLVCPQRWMGLRWTSGRAKLQHVRGVLRGGHGIARRKATHQNGGHDFFCRKDAGDLPDEQAL